jgi:integrase
LYPRRNNYLRDRAGSMMLHAIRTKHIQGWLNDLADQSRVHSRNTQDEKKLAQLESHKLTKTTLSHVKNFVSGIFRIAALHGYIEGSSNPEEANLVTRVRIPKNAPKGRDTYAYSLAEIEAMVKVMDKADPSLMAGTVILAAGFSALRQGELTGLRWECFRPPSADDDLGEIFVTRSIWQGFETDPKTEKSKSPVPVIPILAQRLVRHRQRLGNPETGPMFPNGNGNPTDLNWLANKIRPALKKAGITCWCGWHGFRRGLATNLKDLGVDDLIIRDVLRHSNVQVTQRCYIKTKQPASQGRDASALRVFERHGEPEATQALWQADERRTGGGEFDPETGRKTRFL